MSKAVESKVEGLILGDIDAAGYDLVRVRVTGGAKYATLQVMVERKDRNNITVDDCATVSRMVADIVEGDPDLAERYGLEVSSPGIDRPLIKIQDYQRFQGHIAKVDLSVAVEEQRRFKGKIVGVSGDVVEFATEKGVLSVAFDTIDEAKLVVTDDLLKSMRIGSKG